MTWYSMKKPYRIRKDVEIGMDCVKTKNGWYIPCPPMPKINEMIFVYTGTDMLVRGVVLGYTPNVQ